MPAFTSSRLSTAARLSGLLALGAALLLAVPARAAMPELLPLQAGDIPAHCGCSFGHKPGQILVFWDWEADKQYGVLREAGGLRKLRLYSEKYFPAQHEPPHPGDRMTLQLSAGDWSIQTASEVSRACSPRARQCSTTEYRSRLVVQWGGRERREIAGWGRCGC